MLIFDIETNGLLYNVTSIHCLVIYDTETIKRWSSMMKARLNRLFGGPTADGC